MKKTTFLNLVFLLVTSALAPAATEIRVLCNEIKQQVKGLEYSDEVAQDFVKMVSGWKDEQGRPILVVWKQRLNQARQDYKQGKLSKDRLAKVEESIIKHLSQRIRKEISLDFSMGFFDLVDVIKHRQAQCVSYTQLFYVLGNSVGLSVEAIDVALMASGPLPAGYGHKACLVDLINNKLIMVDLVTGPIISKAFNLEKAFAKVGNYWELKDKDNPSGIHRRIQILDKNGLIAAIYTKRGVEYGKLGQLTKAISDLNKAIKFNPKFAEAYWNRGVTYAVLGQYPKAISDYAKVIELNPKYAGAYYNRGNACRKLAQYQKAIFDYTKAIELNPKYAEAYTNRGIAYADLGKFEEAKKDLLKAVELNPGLKAYVNKVSDHFKLSLKLD